jgi:hypothetical protein
MNDSMSFAFDRKCAQERCDYPASTDSEFCPVHDPAMEDRPLAPRIHSSNEARRLREERKTQEPIGAAPRTVDLPDIARPGSDGPHIARGSYGRQITVHPRKVVVHRPVGGDTEIPISEITAVRNRPARLLAGGQLTIRYAGGDPGGERIIYLRKRQAEFAEVVRLIEKYQAAETGT